MEYMVNRAIRVFLNVFTEFIKFSEKIFFKKNIAVLEPKKPALCRSTIRTLATKSLIDSKNSIVIHCYYAAVIKT